MTGQDTPGRGTAARILDPETLQTSYLSLQLRILALLLQRVLYVSGVHRIVSEKYTCTYLNIGWGTQQNGLGTCKIKATFKIRYIKSLNEKYRAKTICTKENKFQNKSL
jgi:hypothetical protein